tara:strand:- start:526 stop:1092 length:567 start_codon:yes stop_codon:yes gene_type:complete
MSWFNIIKMDYNDEEDNLPREIYDLLQELEDLEDEYGTMMDRIDNELWETCDKIIDFIQKDENLEGKNKNALLNITKEHQRKSVSERHFDTVYHYFTDTYTELTKEEDDDDGYTAPQQGSKNAKAVQAMESFKDQYYENPYSDYRENRDLTAFIAGISNGEPISDLERKFPGAYIVFDSAGLLNEVEE